MKPLSFLSFAFVLPVFGVIACHSDKPPHPDLPHKEETKNSGINYDELNNVKIIDITGSISLGFSDSSENHSRVKSRCWNNYLEKFSGQANIENTESLPVKDILPVRVFSPSSKPETKLFCDFEINILNHQWETINDSKIILEDIEIKNIESYRNFELPLEGLTKDPGKPFYLLKENIENIRFAMPTNEGQVFTLCGDYKKAFSFEEQVLPMTDFFIEKPPGNRGFDFCRFVIHQRSPDRNWITEPFFIQNQKPKITYEYKHNYTANRDNRWDGQKMGTLTLSNPGTFATYLKILPFPTKVSVMAVYSNFSKTDVNYRSGTVPELNVFWTVDDRVPVQKDDTELTHIYKLGPDQSINLSLKTHEGFSCEHGEMVTPLNPVETVGEAEKSNCREKFYMSGILYHLHAFPKVSYNLFFTMDFQDWQPVSLEELHRPEYNGKFSKWVPNYQAPRHCPGVGVKNKLNSYPVQNQTLSHLFECFWDNF